MSGRANISSGKVVLDIELQDLLKIVSKAGNKTPISDSDYDHALAGEDLKKAWFKHVLISMEKLDALIETVRRVDIVDLRNEMKDETKELEIKIDSGLKEADAKAKEAANELKTYKKEVIDPLNTKVLTISVKLGMWGVIGGCVGSGIMGLIFYVIKEYLLKPAITAGP